MFQFKQFVVHQDRVAFKVGTDSILLGATAAHPQGNRILDIGTGTGLLALMLAQKYPHARVDAVEIDPASAQQAQENIHSSPFANRLSLFNEDIMRFSDQSKSSYDLIVCNPPFFNLASSTPSPSRIKRQARHSATLSYDQLLSVVSKLLGENGRFFTIIPFHQKQAFTSKLQAYPLFITHTVKVKPKPSKPAHRLLLTLGKQPKPHKLSYITIETDTHHVYTSDFYQLTKTFYLDLTYG